MLPTLHPTAANLSLRVDALPEGMERQFFQAYEPRQSSVMFWAHERK